MEGVIVHAEHVYRKTPVAASVLVIVLTACLLAWIAWETIQYFRNKKGDRLGMALVLVLAIAILVPLNIRMIDSSCTIHNDLIVTIDDSVCFNEFYEHYEVVSQDGKLYTVRELPIEETEPEEAGDNE